MRFGLHVANFGAFADPIEVAALAQRAEAAGWDGFFLWDHVVRSEGDLPLADPWILLAVVAAATSRLRIGPLITPLSRRRPWNVARQVATLDHLSAGRVVLGVGLGVSQGPELNNFSEETDPATRGDMLDEGITILRQAWSGEPVDHAGTHYRIDSVRFVPPPVQGPSLPIWAATERTTGRPVRRAASLDGIFPFGLRPDDLPALLTTVSRHRKAGLGGFDVVAGGTDDWAAWQAAGATWWLRVLPWRAPLVESVKIVEAGPPAASNPSRE
jgi:alkanesulfonate monooxygenase SsuD/methylene tetrahydromethanopterin reductase-like flavin-dependent oxidoreductase (luciferase family)